MNFETILKTIYYDPKNPGSFGGVNKLFKEAKKLIPNLKITDVKNWLKSQFTYTLHKPLRKNFQRNKVVVTTIDEQWECDLVDMNDFSKENSGFKYILTCIDVFSKYAFAIPLKNKSGQSVKKALENIFKNTKRIPSKIRTDKGREFLNKNVQELFKNYRINFFTSKNEKIKCPIIERWNRTLKNKMYKYFTAKGTRKYVEKLSDFVSSYNSTKHRSIKMKPVEVNENNVKIVFKNLYNAHDLKELYSSFSKEKKLKIGEEVRQPYKLGPFDKSYLPLWEDRVNKIIDIKKGVKRPMYIVENSTGKKYKNELQAVDPKEFRIEKVIKKRKTNTGQTEALVKWMGYSDQNNSWIPLNYLHQLEK